MSSFAKLPDVPWDPQVARYLTSALGQQELTNITAKLSTPPLNTCLRVNTLRASPQDIITRVKQHAVRDAEGWVQSGREPYQPYQLPAAVLVPGSGPNTLDYTCCGGREVVISRKAGEAILRGAHVFVPGVLASTGAINTGDLVAVTVALELPNSDSFGITRGTLLGSEHERGRAAGGAAARTAVGIGRAMMSRGQMFKAQHGVAVSMVERMYDVPSCSGVQQGDCMLQNLPSIVAAQVLAPPPGSRVLDMCAAPGGKTTMLAQVMEDRGTVIALDRSHAKVLEIERLSEELGLSCITAYKMDSTRAVAKQLPSSFTGQLPSTFQGPTTHTVQPAAAAASCQAQPSGQGAASPTASGPTLPSSQLPSVSQPPPTHTSGPQPPPAHTSVPQPSHDPSLSHQRRQSSGELSCTPEQHSSAAQQVPSCTPEQHSSAAQQGNGAAVGSSGSDSDTSQVVDGFMVVGQRGGGIKSEKECKREARRAAAMKLRKLEVKVEGAGATKTGGVQLLGFLPESFDHILLDAPCSALGLRPRLMRRQTLEELQQTASYQRRLIDAAVQLLRPGGSMVYSTCTISPGENEGNVRYALDTYPCLQLVKQEPYLGGPGIIQRSHQQPENPGIIGNAPQQGNHMSLHESQAVVSESTVDALKGASSVSATGGDVCGGGHGNSSDIPDEVQNGKLQDVKRNGQHQKLSDVRRHGQQHTDYAEVWLTETEAGLVQRFSPAAELDTIGFFIAKFQKHGRA